MASCQYEEKPQLGDLIEIDRGIYKHWAVYVGGGDIIHLAPPSELANAGAASLMSVVSNKAKVKKESLCVVAGSDEVTINNLLDDKYEPYPAHVIVEKAHRYLKKELPYCVFSQNCEHFVTELRYGKPECRQVRKAAEAVAIGLGTVAVIGLVVAAANAFLNSGKEERRRTRDL